MAFIQIVDIHAKDFDGLKSIDDQWYAATEGKRTVRRSIITRDRQDPDHYQVIVFFDSYESAMANSALPETERYASRYTEIVDQPISFVDLDVVDDRS